MRSARILTLMAALSLAATGCGGSGSASEETSPSISLPPGAPSSPASASDVARTIRDVDFTSLEWREQVSEQRLTPMSDTSDADPMAGPLVTVGEATFGDVDGDEDEDAMLPLIIADGNSLSEIYYIWTWDEDTETAVQVENPIARAHDCGAQVDEVVSDPSEHAFVVRERLRLPGAEGACADPPTLEAVRIVTLSDGWPVLVNGVGGHGGICPQPEGRDDTWPVEESVLRAGPRERIGTVEDPQVNWFAEADISGYGWLYREGWLLVNFGPFVGDGRDSHFKDYGDYTPCAWIEVDSADHSELGMLS